MPVVGGFKHALVSDVDNPTPLRMFAMGHKRTYAAQNGMSALPPKAIAKVKFRKGYPLYPKSGHVRCKQECPLWANSGHFVRHRRLDRQIEKMIQRLFTKATR